MKGKFEILMVIAVLCLPGVMSGETDPFFCEVDYALSLPMADDDLVFNVRLASESNPSDSLLGYNYLIRWDIPSHDGAEGFTAYFNGNFYDFRDNRLREYHYQWDSIPFLTRSGGVHRNAQFISLFPSSINELLSMMNRDSTFTVATTSASSPAGATEKIHAIRTIAGQEALQLDLERQSSSGYPIKIHELYNPGMIGEQEITAEYRYENIDSTPPPANEAALIALYPEIFSKYRTSNFTVENLRGQPLPSFALLTPTHERFLYEQGRGFLFPTIIAVLDPTVASTPETIATMRQVANQLPRQINLVFAFISNDTDRIEQLVGTRQFGETTLTSARSLARDTGINSYPTLLLVNQDGTVADVILGHSTDLPSLLLQKSSLLK